jgi:hypothetical protein
MKRNSSKNSSNDIKTLRDDELPRFPAEILNEISQQVWNVCLSVPELLSWHSTCTHFWEEYTKIDDEKILLFIAEKRKRNHELLHKTFQSQYSKNTIVLTQYETIIRILMRVKERVIAILPEQHISLNIAFPIKDWETWGGIHFDEKDYLSKQSLSILRALSPRLYYRYGWRLLFSAFNENSEKLKMRFPWTTHPIEANSKCYLGSNWTSMSFPNSI